MTFPQRPRPSGLPPGPLSAEGPTAGSQPLCWWGPGSGPEVAVRRLQFPSPATPAPPLSPRRRGAAAHRLGRGDVCGDNSRADHPCGDDPGGSHARVGGTPPLPCTSDPQTHAPGPRGSRPRSASGEEPHAELGARPGVAAGLGTCRGLAGHLEASGGPISTTCASLAPPLPPATRPGALCVVPWSVNRRNSFITSSVSRPPHKYASPIFCAEQGPWNFKWDSHCFYLFCMIILTMAQNVSWNNSYSVVVDCLIFEG